MDTEYCGIAFLGEGGYVKFRTFACLVCRNGLRLKHAALRATILLLLITVTSDVTQGQAFTVLHNFTGGQDGANPTAGDGKNEGSMKAYAYLLFLYIGCCANIIQWRRSPRSVSKTSHCW